jgi:hypothetical protein
VGRHLYGVCIPVQLRRERTCGTVTDIGNSGQLRPLFHLPAHFPVSLRRQALLIGIGSIILTLAGRPEDIITSGITTAVVMVVAGISPQHGWEQPILRLIDTLVGIGVGIIGAWISLHWIDLSLIRQRRHQRYSSGLFFLLGSAFLSSRYERIRRLFRTKR